MKKTIIDLVIILAALFGITLLLRKGDQAGAGKTTPASPPLTTRQPTPIRPPTIAARVDNFREPIGLEAIRAWDAKPRYGIALNVSPDPKLNQPSARVVLLQPTTTPVILEVQYTTAESAIQMLSANDAIKSRTDGVTILITTVGIAYNQSSLLKLDPLRLAEQRKWLTHNLALPPGTTEVDFSIIGSPPDYNVFGDSCIISLPQLRVVPAR